MRLDKGGENVLVCRFMVTYRGIGRGSHLAGSSVHNQRIKHVFGVMSIDVCAQHTMKCFIVWKQLEC